MHILDHCRPYRPLLWGMAILGFVGVNGVFPYYTFRHPGRMVDALQNPISAAFIFEALLMTAVLAWAVWVTDLEEPGWVSFVVLSIVGSLAFSVPAFLLLHLRKRADART